VFDIEFIAEEPELQEEGWWGLWGRTTLGDYSERFLAPLDRWQRGDYERQWIEAAERLLHESDRTGFSTQAGRFWWTMWRQGERVYVHEELLTPERLATLTAFDGAPYALIEDRATRTEDGAPISEWELTVADVQAFVARRAGQYVPA
jgi:hypothetical protein